MLPRAVSLSKPRSILIHLLILIHPCARKIPSSLTRLLINFELVKVIWETLEMSPLRTLILYHDDIPEREDMSLFRSFLRSHPHEEPRYLSCLCASGTNPYLGVILPLLLYPPSPGERCIEESVRAMGERVTNEVDAAIIYLPDLFDLKPLQSIAKYCSAVTILYIGTISYGELQVR